MNHGMDFEHENFRAELRELGATDMQATEMVRDPGRARAALARAAGTTNPIALMLTLYRSPTFLAPKRQENLRAAAEVCAICGYALRSDEGYRIWHFHEVDLDWRREYLDCCLQAMQDPSKADDPWLPRYQPSDEEFDEWLDVMSAMGVPVDVSPANLRATAERALEAWAVVWRFSDTDPRSEDLVFEVEA